jgi:hypothetical protein
VLREFVIASMGIDGAQHEFNEAGLRLLGELSPRLCVDTNGAFGRLADSLGLLVHSATGLAGFDPPAAAILGLLGNATVGALYAGDDADCGRQIAGAAHDVWGQEWHARLNDAASYVAQMRPAPFARLTASLTYLDANRSCAARRHPA